MGEMKRLYHRAGLGIDPRFDRVQGLDEPGCAGRGEPYAQGWVCPEPLHQCIASVLERADQAVWISRAIASRF